MRVFLHFVFLGGLALANIANAELASIDNDELDAETAQAGVALALELRLNADATGTSLCGGVINIVECRLAIGLNNRGTAGTDQEWLVMKGIYGRINVPYLTLDADSVTYTNDSAGTTTVPAVKLGYGGTANKIQIQNYTISNMSIEHDNQLTAAGKRGYMATSEDGFLGMQINGDVAISGTLKMFPCNPDHPRC